MHGSEAQTRHRPNEMPEGKQGHPAKQVIKQLIYCSLLIAWLVVGHSKGTKKEILISIVPRLYAAEDTEKNHAALRTAYLQLDGANATGNMAMASKRKVIHEQHLALVTDRQKLDDKLHAQTK